MVWYYLCFLASTGHVETYPLWKRELIFYCRLFYSKVVFTDLYLKQQITQFLIVLCLIPNGIVTHLNLCPN